MAQGFFLGNELMAHAAKIAGVSSFYAYPGTPSSEILSVFQNIAPDRYSQWSLNEKLALELSAAAAISGSFSLCSMKQVGLNVAADPLFSVAYTGVSGAMVIISADDPGPHSSQTEQDSRMYAYSAKIPVLDPSTPADAFRLMLKAYEISSKFKTPVMIRPVMRVCHSRQNFDIPNDFAEGIKGTFVKDAPRWSATPKYRAMLHNKVIENLKNIAASEDIKPAFKNRYAIVASGYPFALAEDIIGQNSEEADLIKIDMPFPISEKVIADIESHYEKILVLEETFPLIERAFRNRLKVFGKDTGTVISAGEFSIEECKKSINIFLNKPIEIADVREIAGIPPAPKPRLCAGCGHRPSFYAIKRAVPNGILPGDIGCYTLGTNLKAVDTCICMGASITFAESLKRENPEKDVVCTIGDSTFFHTGIPALLNAYLNKAPIVVAILDNETTAMTGFQPVPHAGGMITLESVITGLGVKYIKETDPYNIKGSIAGVKAAVLYAKMNNTPAVVIFRKECITHTRSVYKRKPVVNKGCTNCGICYEIFECPAITSDGESISIDYDACNACGCCIDLCPVHVITEGE